MAHSSAAAPPEQARGRASPKNRTRPSDLGPYRIAPAAGDGSPSKGRTEPEEAEHAPRDNGEGGAKNGADATSGLGGTARRTFNFGFTSEAHAPAAPPRGGPPGPACAPRGLHGFATCPGRSTGGPRPRPSSAPLHQPPQQRPNSSVGLPEDAALIEAYRPADVVGARSFDDIAHSLRQRSR